VPETCLDRFVDLKGLTQQVSGELPYRRCEVKLHLDDYGVNQAIKTAGKERLWSLAPAGP
jgi:hypothetical protein